MLHDRGRSPKFDGGRRATRPNGSGATARYSAAGHFVESRMGASTDARSAAPFPIPAHQTGRAQLRHPAFRLASAQTHKRVPTLARLSCNTPNSPNTALMLKRLVPPDGTCGQHGSWPRLRRLAFSPNAGIGEFAPLGQINALAVIVNEPRVAGARSLRLPDGATDTHPSVCWGPPRMTIAVAMRTEDPRIRRPRPTGERYGNIEDEKPA